MGKFANPQVVWKALDEVGKGMPDEVMYIYKGEKISFRQVDDASDHVASGLLNLGFKKGDRIGVIAHNQPEWIYTYFAAAKNRCDYRCAQCSLSGHGTGLHAKSERGSDGDQPC